MEDPVDKKEDIERGKFKIKTNENNSFQIVECAETHCKAVKVRLDKCAERVSANNDGDENCVEVSGR